jgi:hypothetical protein
MRSRLLPTALAVVLIGGCAPVTRVFIEFETPPTPAGSPAPVVTPVPFSPEPTLNPTPAPTPEPSTPEPTLEPITFDNITVEQVGPDYAVISWNVDPPAQGWIEYGTDQTYGSETTRELSLLGFHRQRISGLQPETQYHFRIIALIPDPDGGEPLVASVTV